LVLLGTDTLESLFGNVRTLTHARNCDYLELNERLKIAQQIDLINTDPTWKKANRLSVNTETTDHSSINEWIGNLATTNIFVEITWKYGSFSAVSILTSFGFNEAELIIENSN
jgi:hypothetical protein